MFAKILCLDFDGVIHSYTSGWKGPRTIPDPPVDGALLFLLRAVKRFDVVVHSSRSRYWGGRRAMRRWLKFHAGNMWYPSPAGQGLESVRFVKAKPPAMLTIDDRAMQFEGRFPDLELVDRFKPWNKRSSGDPFSVVRRRDDGPIHHEQNPCLGSIYLRGRVVDHLDETVASRAVELLREKLDSETLDTYRRWIAEDPENWMHSQEPGWHFVGGMAIRNLLRTEGCGEEQLGVANLDDVYTQLVELAVSADGERGL